MPLNFLRKQNYKQTTSLHAVANATYEISVVSYTYAAKGEHNVEVIKKPKGLNHKIIIRRNM